MSLCDDRSSFLGKHGITTLPPLEVSDAESLSDEDCDFPITGPPMMTDRPVRFHERASDTSPHPGQIGSDTVPGTRSQVSRLRCQGSSNLGHTRQEVPQVWHQCELARRYVHTFTACPINTSNRRNTNAQRKTPPALPTLLDL